MRWRVTTKLGSGGYVDTVAFPAPTGTQAMVVVRLHADAGEDGPPLKQLDQVIKGIEPAG